MKKVLAIMILVSLVDTVFFTSPAYGDPAISFGNVQVKLNPRRGAAIESIYINGVGETIVDDMDGRGIGTSGFLFNETGGELGGLWSESGCISNGGNADTLVTLIYPSRMIGLSATNVQYKSAKYPCERISPWKNFQIIHEVSFPSPVYNGIIAVKQSLQNRTGKTVTLTRMNEGFHWPLAPQAHFDKTKFTDPRTGKGYWRYRMADGNWRDLPVDASRGFISPRDFYLPDGNAVAVYRDNLRSFGVAMYCKRLNSGFYVKDMTEFKIMFVASVWDFTTPMLNYGTASKTCHIIYGSEAVISSAIKGL